MTVPRLHVETAGDGSPVVLLHGLTATHRYVVMGSKHLERSGHRVISYDARSHGQSGPGEAYGYGELAADLERVMDDHGVERAVLAGASMGAHTMLRFALVLPERVAGLVVITPAYHEDADPDMQRWRSLAQGLRHDGVEGFIDAYQVEALPRQWQDTIRTVLEQRMSLHEDQEALADAIEQVPLSQPFEEVADLGALEGIPVTIVSDRDEADPGHPLWVGETYAEAIPGSTFVVEDEGKSPIAWQGGQLSKIIAAVAAEADFAPR